MSGITEGPWTAVRQGPSCATIWAGDQCVFDAIDVAGNDANLVAIAEVPALIGGLRLALALLEEYLPAEKPASALNLDHLRAVLARIDSGRLPEVSENPAPTTV